MASSLPKWRITNTIILLKSNHRLAIDPTSHPSYHQRDCLNGSYLSEGMQHKCTNNVNEDKKAAIWMASICQTRIMLPRRPPKANSWENRYERFRDNCKAKRNICIGSTIVSQRVWPDSPILNVFGDNFTNKIAPILSWVTLGGYFENINFFSKNCCGFFLGFL